MIDASDIAVVTGAAGGLGLGLARNLARRGSKVVLADVDQTALEEAAASVAELGVGVMLSCTDVTKSAEVDELARRTEERFGTATIVCANAGVSALGNAWELTEHDYSWVYGVNVWGTIHLIRAFVPGMVAADRGHVVVIASNTAVTAHARYAAYGSSKHAVLAIAESLQLDLRAVGSRIAVTAVLPGPIHSRMADTQRRRPPELGPPSVARSEVEAIRAFLAERGDDPDQVGHLILDAVDDRRFYVFTKPDDIAMVHSRSDDIARGFLGAGTSWPVVSPNPFGVPAPPHG